MRNHSDCAHFVSADGVRGVCAWTNEPIAGDFVDAGLCPQFKRIAKCKNCFCYKPEKDGMGECVGLGDGGLWAFAEMIAKQCPGYQAGP